MTAPRLVVILDALAARFGGTAYTVLQLTRALERCSDVASVVVVAQQRSIVGDGVQASEKVLPVLLSAPSSRLELAWRLAWEARELPKLVVDQRADVLVSLAAMLPRHPGCPLICVLANPVPFASRRRAGSRVRRLAIERTLRGAVAGYVPSEGMRVLTGIDGLEVVPLGVDHTRFRPAATPGTELLCVADFYSHKRHDRLIAAWDLLREPKPTLRLIGNPSVDRRTFAAVRAAAKDERIIIDGRVAFAALHAAYARARALVLCSERESFAMPLAEGLACGVPVVVGDDPILRETAGPGGLIVTDNTPGGWAHALERVLGDDALHAGLRLAGLAHSRRFSWDTMAQKVVADARRSC